MRSIGSCNSPKDAILFVQYLTSLSIEAKTLTPEEVEIWIFDDEDLERAKSLFSAFLHNPYAKKFETSNKGASSSSDLPNTTISKTSHTKNFFHKQQSLFEKIFKNSNSLYYVSVTCIAISSLVAYITKLGDVQEVNQYLIFSVPQILDGEIWRIFSPMFLHFGLLHFIFNMLWLMDLGLYLETEKGSKIVLVLIICTNLFANPIQFIVSGSYFGGMSGVIYALFGYIWTKMQIDPSSNLHIDTIKSIILLASFLMSFIGILGNVANVIHSVGLLTGVVLAVVGTPNGTKILTRTIRNILK